MSLNKPKKYKTGRRYFKEKRQDKQEQNAGTQVDPN